MAGIGKSKKTSIESTIEDQLKELKDLLQETNQKVTSLQTQISNNHSELLVKVDAADKNAKEALQLAKNNEAIIDELRQENQTLKEKIKADIIEGADNSVKKYMANKDSVIPQIEAQIKGVFIDLEDLRNQSMRLTLIFKNIKEENESIWEDSTRVLGKFISPDLDMNYTDEEINMFISRDHRDSQGSAKKSSQKIKTFVCAVYKPAICRRGT